jgi:hypothetical protein
MACPDPIGKWADPAYVARVERNEWQAFLDRLTGWHRFSKSYQTQSREPAAEATPFSDGRQYRSGTE